MNITLCDRCGKELSPADSYTATFEAGEFTPIRDPRRLKYDLCRDCAKIVIKAITDEMVNLKRKV